MQLHLRIIEAKDLPKMDQIFGATDSFCVVQLGTNTKTYRTKIQQKTLSPYWNDEFHLPVSDNQNETLVLAVYHDDVTQPIAISSVRIPLQFMLCDQVDDRWYSLQPEQGIQTGGQIHIISHLAPSSSLPHKQVGDDSSQRNNSADLPKLRPTTFQPDNFDYQQPPQFDVNLPGTDQYRRDSDAEQFFAGNLKRTKTTNEIQPSFRYPQPQPCQQSPQPVYQPSIPPHFQLQPTYSNPNSVSLTYGEPPSIPPPFNQVPQPSSCGQPAPSVFGDFPSNPPPFNQAPPPPLYVQPNQSPYNQQQCSPATPPQQQLYNPSHPSYGQQAPLPYGMHQPPSYSPPPVHHTYGSQPTPPYDASPHSQTPSYSSLPPFAHESQLPPQQAYGPSLPSYGNAPSQQTSYGQPPPPYSALQNPPEYGQPAPTCQQNPPPFIQQPSTPPPFINQPPPYQQIPPRY